MRKPKTTENPTGLARHQRPPRRTCVPNKALKLPRLVVKMVTVDILIDGNMERSWQWDIRVSGLECEGVEVRGSPGTCKTFTLSCCHQTCQSFGLSFWEYNQSIILKAVGSVQTLLNLIKKLLFILFSQRGAPCGLTLRMNSCYRSSLTVWTSCSGSTSARLSLAMFLEGVLIILLRQFSLTSPVRPPDTSQVWQHMFGLKRTCGEEGGGKGSNIMQLSQEHFLTLIVQTVDILTELDESYPEVGWVLLVGLNSVYEVEPVWFYVTLWHKCSLFGILLVSFCETPRALKYSSNKLD